ncbi:MAG: type IV pilus secretin PilQ [Candidatus Aminicenantales bacterium]
MRKKIYVILAVSFLLFTPWLGSVQGIENFVRINRVSVYSEASKEKVILETDAPLHILRTYYSSQPSPGLVLEIDRVNTERWPVILPENSLFVKSIGLKKIGDNKLKLHLEVNEQVPYSITSSPKETVLELLKSDPNQEIDDKKLEFMTTENSFEPEEKIETPSAEEKETSENTTAVEEKYTGEILSLKVKDADLRDVVLYLGEFAGLNVVFDPEVQGMVTCDLVDVPWDQAMDIILKINKMGRTLEGNVLRIAPLQVLAEEEKQHFQLRESREMASPLQVKTITLSYSEAKKIQQLLSPKLSPRGEIIVDERTNTLIISDVGERINVLEQLISVLDAPTPQVSIEARIVEASSQFVRNLGIQWGFLGEANTNLNFPSNILIDGSMIKGNGGPAGGYAINLPAPAFNSALGISLGNILDTFKLDMALTAMESSGEGRIISCPKITTQNNMEAEIIQGRQIPVQTVANFSVTTTFRNAALELKVKPQITADNTIIMNLEITNNSPDWGREVNGIPPINTQTAKTTVMIRDGGTTVIGGIYRTEDSVSKEGVPFLSQIPLLGNLFRSRSRSKENTELLIFITPRIVK